MHMIIDFNSQYFQDKRTDDSNKQIIYHDYIN